MWGSPGSGSMYSRACRQFLPPNCHPCGASPTTYFAEKPGCRPCIRENLHAPFLSSAERKFSWGCDPDIPGPGLYYPKKPCCVSQGTYKLCKPTHIPFKKADDCIEKPGFILPTDPWSKNSVQCPEPRVCREKWVLEPKNDLWSTQPRYVDPDPGFYDTREIRTSLNPGSSCTKFGNPPRKSSKCSIALNDFECSAGDYNLRGPFCQKGGAFLSKTACPDRSIPRYLEDVYNKGIKSCYPGPGSYKPWNRPSIAITSPFKSQLSRCECSGDSGPGPNEYFKQKYCLEDLDPCDDSYLFIRRYPPSKAPFLTSDARFGPESCSKMNGSPPPTAYNIRGFAQELLIKNCKKRAAIENPKLGFGSSCCQRPLPRPEEFFDLDSQYCNWELQERCWRNLRPKPTIPCYHGPPPKNEGPPPSAYDTRCSINYIKGKKDFWDPRKVTGIGFNNSGCNSGPGNYLNVDFDIPGPGTYKAEKPKCPGHLGCTGVGMAQESRDKPLFPETDGPGPGNTKPHEKYGSSVWRATHLGTFNVDLKNICPTTPTAGGYHPKGPIDEIADQNLGIVRDL